MKNLLKVSLLFLVAICLIGCVEPQQPKVEFIDYKIGQITASGIEVNFNFNVENPNPLPIEIEKYNYTVFINNQEFLAENRQGFGIGAGEKKRITIPVNLSYTKVFGTVLNLINMVNQGKTTLDYRIEGSIKAGSLGIHAESPINASGTIPLPKDIKL
jgi:LEA14-like dessication related protein